MSPRRTCSRSSAAARGERYIAGGVNLTLGGAVAAHRASGGDARSGQSGSPMRWPPPPLASDALRVRITGGQPAIPLEGVRHGPAGDVLLQRQGRRGSSDTGLRARRRNRARRRAGIATTAMPPEAPVRAICAMGVEAWGVRRRAPASRASSRSGIGGQGRPSQMTGIVISAGLCGGLLPDQVPGPW